jgi:hypothetical protein
MPGSLFVSWLGGTLALGTAVELWAFIASLCLLARGCRRAWAAVRNGTVPDDDQDADLEALLDQPHEARGSAAADRRGVGDLPYGTDLTDLYCPDARCRTVRQHAVYLDGAVACRGCHTVTPSRQ